MPLVIYQHAHGRTDFPHHFALFSALEERGLLDRCDFVLDTYMDPAYCRLLVRRFPQLGLAVDRSASRRFVQWLKENVGRGVRWFTSLDRFDAVCEAPGGRLNPVYTGRQGIFWLYPRVQRRAILFHSIEEGILEQPAVRRSVGESDLVVARTSASAEVAHRCGARKVVESCDIVFRHRPPVVQRRPGIAVALRLPNLNHCGKYVARLRQVLDWLEDCGRSVDHVRIEEPVGAEMDRRGYLSGEHPNVQMYQDDFMYHPFRAERDAIISARLHTTVLAMLHGNRRFLQLHVEDGTTKLQQFRQDLGLEALPVHGRDDLTMERVRDFLDEPPEIPGEQLESAIGRARQKVEVGLDAFQEWLEGL